VNLVQLLCLDLCAVRIIRNCMARKYISYFYIHIVLLYTYRIVIYISYCDIYIYIVLLYISYCYIYSIVIYIVLLYTFEVIMGKIIRPEKTHSFT
jgi:hypothetical protein